MSVPPALRTWFVIHFVADLLFAIPLFVAPAALLSLFGWTQVDPAMSRVVAAALFGIGIESLLGRNASAESFRTMLNLKLIWSSSATVGIAVSALQGSPPAAWLFAGIFGSFFFVWLYWRVRLGRAVQATTALAA